MSPSTPKIAGSSTITPASPALPSGRIGIETSVARSVLPTTISFGVRKVIPFAPIGTPAPADPSPTSSGSSLHTSASPPGGIRQTAPVESAT